MKTKFIVYAELLSKRGPSRISDAAVEIAQTKVINIAEKIRSDFKGQEILVGGQWFIAREIFIAEVPE